MNTAITELIEDVKANINGCHVALNEEGLSVEDRRHYITSIIVAKDVIKKATELLEKEEQTIKQAYIQGYANGVGLPQDKLITDTQYFNETFK